MSKQFVEQARMPGTAQVDPKKLNFAMVEPEEEVVMSGIAGKFPTSSNMKELKENLLNKVDLITDSRWAIDYPGIPNAGGIVDDLAKFDAPFFGIHYKQAHTLNPLCRILLEKTYEAIIDVGINPRELKGSNTGVVVGCSYGESEKVWLYEKDADGFGITGCTKAMLANRISYLFGFHGPSYTIDTACSSSLCALDHAYRMIRTGTSDAVIVGRANLCLHPYMSLQLARLGLLSTDYRCKDFEAAANGYVRSEAIGMILLQKAKDAKRIYSQIVYTKTNCDGYKEQGITFPANNIKKMLLTDFYNECQISPNCLSFLEAHGTGTSVGDPEELNAIEQAFCQGRTTPLKIGTIKSNLGHTEPSSGLCSIAKVIIGMESWFIPPNLHFETPKKGIRCLEEGRAQVIVLEKTLQNQTLLLLKKEEKPPQRTEVVYVNNNEFRWLKKVKEILKNEEEKKTDETVRLVLVAQGDTENGLLGLVKWLRLEPNGKIMKAMIIQDENAPLFSLKDPYYAAILDIDIGYNVIRPGRVWGTYRHLPLPPPAAALVPNAYANVTVRGNLSSIRWIEGQLKPDMENGTIVKVVYSSLNFRDVMLATGKLPPETIAKDAAEAECLIGFEFSGISSNGRRVMGFTQSKGISNFVNPHHFSVWPVPDKWSLEDAATIPSAYCTVFYAFFYLGKLKRGEKVLIHSGSGAVGEAAINVALAEGCKVFTTVETAEKQKFIKETFSSIGDDHIGNSRNTSVEQIVMKQTHGEGVNVVLNSLSEDKHHVTYN